MSRGDDKEWNATITKDIDGSATNLAGCTLWFTAKYGTGDADPGVFQKKTGGLGIVITDATNGLCTISVAKTDTSGIAGETWLQYDLQIRDSLGKIQTFVRGRIHVLDDVTVSTS